MAISQSLDHKVPGPHIAFYVASGGPDDVGNRNTLVSDAEKWGSRYEELG